MSKKILVTGIDGQLGQALVDNMPVGYQVLGTGRAALDIADSKVVADWFATNKPSGVINAAAYTAVDKAETDLTTAQAANAEGPKHLASACKELGIPMVQVSTDFVFDGKSSSAYKPQDSTRPLGVYGATKREGELAVLNTEGLSAAVIRTAWVYNADSPNFVNTMLRLMAEKDSLSVVADQIGTPTYVPGLAQACWTVLEKQLTGIFHWTDAGVASWYDFAVAIQEEAIAAGLLKRAIPIAPVTTADFPTPAARPGFSVLDKTTSWQQLGVQPVHWRVRLREALAAKK